VSAERPVAEYDVKRKMIHAWCMYDWANSGFATTVMAAVLPVYYGAVAANNLSPTVATAYWGYTNTIGMLIVAFVAPLLGAVADHSGSRKRFLGAFAILGIFFTALMVLIGAGDWKLASALYVLALFGWSSANIFYDSLLPHIAGHDQIDRVSSRGYALGYLGGGILLFLNLLMIKPELAGLASFPGIPDSQWGVSLSFVSVALWWGLFSLPLFLYVEEPPTVTGTGESANSLAAGFQRLAQTLKEMRRYGELFKFLIAFWLYNDGITSISSWRQFSGRRSA
jgi:MFS transporter, UMF1 family